MYNDNKKNKKINILLFINNTFGNINKNIKFRKSSLGLNSNYL